MSTALGPPLHHAASWQLESRTSTYAVSLGFGGTALVHDYFGPTVRPAPRWTAPTRQPTFSTYADLAPLEYAVLGTRHVHRSELILERHDGARGVLLSHTGDDLLAKGLQTHLVVRFAGEGVELEQHLMTRRDSDVVEKWVVVRSTRKSGHRDDRVRLPRVLSGALNIEAPYGSRLHVLSGAWSSETTPSTVDLRAGVLQLGSRQGVTGHLFAPTMAVELLNAEGAPDGTAGAYGVALAWSGSWTMAAEPHPNGLLRVSAGLDDEGTVVQLSPGQELVTPHLLLVHAPDGPDGVARRWHEHQRRHLSRSIGPEHRPVVYNSWCATGFDVRPDRQAALADQAVDLGAEVFVVDDGWFVGRNDDTTSLGDWRPDPAVFPEGLGPLVEHVLSRGMRFGLWVEPEAISRDSDLYREHPEWVHRVAGQPLVTIRQQLVLDFGRADVRAWCGDMLRALLTTYPISYLKWDMNRPVTGPGQPGDSRSLEWTIAHTEGYYSLLRMLRSEFPQLTVEACSAGGGRIDNAVLGLTDVVWPSDETGARDRLVIQDGFLRAYPPHVMSSWVTDEPGSRDTAPVSLAFRCITAMAGVMGLGADLTRWDETARDETRGLVELYKELRPVLHGGAVHRHGDPSARGYAVEYVGEDGRLVVLVWDTARERGSSAADDAVRIAPVRVRLTGAAPGRVYRLTGDGSLHGGAALCSAGIVVPWRVGHDADVLVLDPLPDDEAADVS